MDLLSLMRSERADRRELDTVAFYWRADGVWAVARGLRGEVLTSMLMPLEIARKVDERLSDTHMMVRFNRERGVPDLGWAGIDPVSDAIVAFEGVMAVAMRLGREKRPEDGTWNCFSWDVFPIATDTSEGTEDLPTE